MSYFLIGSGKQVRQVLRWRGEAGKVRGRGSGFWGGEGRVKTLN
ncbi:hypothetical protein E2C01_081166 [Portunus trituberculatus]|uniref:Uncharacterized protein n=1 Tax=Portunus trituberculatus TaxID=210409 RepID=A0A5B7IVJ3_PORTR|nr:hypothetical protein [Portunus trituberculatus]